VAFSMLADVVKMAFSPGGELFASGDARGGAMVWQTDGIYLATLRHDEPISHLSFSPDAGYLAVASLDSAVRLWPVAPGLLVESVRAIVSGPLSAEEWTRYLA